MVKVSYFCGYFR